MRPKPRESLQAHSGTPKLFVLGIHFQRLVLGLLVPGDLPQIPLVDALTAHLAGVEMVALVGRFAADALARSAKWRDIRKSRHNPSHIQFC